MKNKTFGFIFAFVFIVLCGINAKADGLQSTRLYGLDRYETNKKIVQQGWQESDYAVIVSGENFPDALSASVLAKKYNAPIILSGSMLGMTPKEFDDFNDHGLAVSIGIEDELKRLGVKKAFIIGGPAVLSDTVEHGIQKIGISTERIYGDNRYATSIAVANKIGTENGVIITTGDDYADALSIAPVAGKLQMPIILSQRDVLTSMQKNFVANNTIPKTYIIGNTDIISDNVATKFSNVQRITGDNKYDRNLNIINAFSNDFDFSKAILASGENFPDALSGSAFAGLNGNPIYLIGAGWNDNYSSDNNSIETALGNKNTNNLYALGGISIISDDILNSIVRETNALDTLKAKIQIDSNLEFEIVDNYSYDGSNYYHISLCNYSKYAKKWVTYYYQYGFLVDTETGDTYKIDNTNKITPLDITNISSDACLTIDKAMDLVKSKINLDANETLYIPSDESQMTFVYNGALCYQIVENYSGDGDPNHSDEICEYLVNISTGEITKCNQGQYTPIK